MPGMMRYSFTLLIAAGYLLAQPKSAFGPVVNGLRASLAVTEANNEKWLDLTFENVSGKYLYLPLGTIGSGRLEAVRLTTSQDEKQESNLVFQTKARLLARSL
jgi:hypothetical protein